MKEAMTEGEVYEEAEMVFGMDKPHEECGVFGIFSLDGADVIGDTYHALHALQHRGQESCGMAFNRDGVITGHKDLGLVTDVFTTERLAKLAVEPPAQMAVGHCRYGTTEKARRSNAQPLVIQHLKGGMALANNGSITNAAEIREEMEKKGGIFQTTSDTEVVAYVVTAARMESASIQEALGRAMDRLQGAYSLVVMSPTKLIAARDPLGFRPLCLGRRGDCWMFASESCAFDILEAEFVRDIQPGEIVTITKDGIQSDTSHCQEKTALCVFEFIYFARPDSVIDGSSVHTARQRAGAFLALEHPVHADVVIGVPDSGLDAALGYAKQSGIPYGVGFIKNKYIGRTFIQPGQKRRENAVRIKLNVLKATVQGKRVVLVDDSIVRGTTSALIVRLLREAGAAEVHMRLSSPPFLFPCWFGTDIDSTEHLIAHNHTVEEIAEIIGVDSLGFLSIEAVDKLADQSVCGFCSGCFTGEYPSPPPKCAGVSKFEKGLSGKS